MAVVFLRCYDTSSKALSNSRCRSKLRLKQGRCLPHRAGQPMEVGLALHFGCEKVEGFRNGGVGAFVSVTVVCLSALTFLL